MLTYLYSNIFETPAQVLVNTVNTEGVMGKGIAKHFKILFPAMFKEYRVLCDTGDLTIGKLHLWKGNDRWVLNFPTKTSWRLPSEIGYIENGLKTFVRQYESMGVSSVSFPPLGCGNGGLNWDDVQPLMERYLSNLSAQVFIHNVQVGKDFVPEHIEGVRLPTEFEQFWDDVLASVYRNKGLFHTAALGDYGVQLDKRELKFESHDINFTIEQAEGVWLALRDGMLSIDTMPSNIRHDLVEYIFPVLKQLPYIKEAKLSRFHDAEDAHLSVLYFDRSLQKTMKATSVVEDQKCLSL